ncbi:uncharacterized protein JCM6883_002029 [Sporobolomyces salmoneus]|uniref:uncharacterized protein n=1 Tax=Sporobolomyces salmoneus TaxID=183962 RepID=UPI003175F9A6
MDMDAHSIGTSATHPYTCLSCSLAFVDASSQREHYATELHRYNARRRVAGLQPVTKETFESKVQSSTSLAAGGGGGAGEKGKAVQGGEGTKKLACKACNKTFASSATHEAHIKTKKHQDNVFKQASKVKVSDLSKPEQSEEDVPMEASTSASPVPSTSTAPPPSAPTATDSESIPFESSGDATLDRLVAKRLLYAPPLPPTSCLFCPHPSFSTAQETVQHMRLAHSFVIPEEQYLVDLEGLLKRLGEEVGTWNVCVCCGKGYGGNIELGKEEDKSEEELRKKASKGVEAVRAHMQSKSHCRLKYDTEEEQLNIADFYDFRSSYPDYQARLERRAARRAEKAAKQAAEGWEDEEMAEGEPVDEDAEIVYESNSDSDDSSDDDSDDGSLPDGGSGITYGDTEYELVLPSGARIGHRKHQNIHKQNLLPYLDGTPFGTPPPHASQAAKKPSAHSQALLSLVPMMKKDKTHAKPIYEAGLIPAKGSGFGGKNGEVIKARNKGEAKEAGKATRQFKEMRRFTDQALIKGIRGNNQKHFRDPFLQ